MTASPMTPEAGGKAGRNWWKLAFFVALIAFEFTREIAVLKAHQPMGGQMFSMGHYGSLIHAEGQWFRSDGGSPLLPGTVSIDCFQEWNTCIESATILDNSGFISANTSTDLYEIERIDETGVTYVGDALCATYRARIDLQQKRVFATRTIKDGASGPMCSTLEKRLEMQLGDGLKHLVDDQSWRDSLNVPLLKLLWKVF